MGVGRIHNEYPHSSPQNEIPQAKAGGFVLGLLSPIETTTQILLEQNLIGCAVRRAKPRAEIYFEHGRRSHSE